MTPAPIQPIDDVLRDKNFTIRHLRAKLKVHEFATVCQRWASMSMEKGQLGPTMESWIEHFDQETEDFCA
jgi:hypothetical protein